MTQALKAMVEAMAAELVRQARDDDGTQSFPAVGELQDGKLLGFDGLIDLEKVARAGLETIIDGDRISSLDDEISTKSVRIIEAVQSARVPSVEDVAAWGESIGNYRQELLQLAAILKETP